MQCGKLEARGAVTTYANLFGEGASFCRQHESRPWDARVDLRDPS